MLGIGPTELLLILAIGLLVLGPGKLADSGAAMGRAVRDFRRAVEDKPDDSAPAGHEQGGGTTGGDAH